MLIATHAINASLIAPLIPTVWQQVADSSFGSSNVNSVTYHDGTYVAVGDS